MLCPAGVNPGVIKKTDRLISSQSQLPLLSATGSNIAAIGGHKGGRDGLWNGIRKTHRWSRLTWLHCVLQDQCISGKSSCMSEIVLCILIICCLMHRNAAIFYKRYENCRRFFCWIQHKYKLEMSAVLYIFSNVDVAYPPAVCSLNYMRVRTTTVQHCPMHYDVM